MPFRDRVQFEVADFLYHCNQMSASNINFITGLWAASLAAHGDEPPFKHSKDMYKIFLTTGVWTSFNLLHQHALIHYTKSIHLFGSLNGLCSSITESKYIKAVKEPWWRSGHFEALHQMLLTNQCADKLTAARADFKKWGMLKGTCLSSVLVNLSMLHCFHWLSDIWPKGSI